MDDLETAARVNAALEAAQFSTTMFSWTEGWIESGD
jgi:hypothetical protein